MGSARNEVPTILSFHVEPDRYQIGRDGPGTWHGYDLMHGLAETLRCELIDRAGTEARFSWHFRMDPQIAQTHPSADYAVSAFPKRFEQLVDAGDFFGIHVHPLRWSEQRDLWIHDFDDSEWVRHCIGQSVDTFRTATGSHPRLHTFGASFLTNDAIAALEELDVWVDVTPAHRYRTRAQRSGDQLAFTGVDDSPIVGRYPDLNYLPRRPYRPNRADVRRPDAANGRQVVLVPLTTWRVGRDRPLWRRVASRVKHAGNEPAVTMHPSRPWESGGQYWDLVESELETMSSPYVAINVRTDTDDAPAAKQVRAVLEALPSHPIAKRLRFVDPIETALALLEPRARAGLTWAT